MIGARTQWLKRYLSRVPLLSCCSRPFGADYCGDVNCRFLTQTESLSPPTGSENWKIQTLPLARIKKIMKSEEFIMQELERDRLLEEGQNPDDKPAIKFMISAEAPLLMSKACELLIREISSRAWQHTERNRRRTLQKQDVHAAVGESEVYDFLIDIVPRLATGASSRSAATAAMPHQITNPEPPPPQMPQQQQHHQPPPPMMPPSMPHQAVFNPMSAQQPGASLTAQGVGEFSIQDPTQNLQFNPSMFHYPPAVPPPGALGGDGNSGGVADANGAGGMQSINIGGMIPQHLDPGQSQQHQQQQQQQQAPAPSPQWIDHPPV